MAVAGKLPNHLRTLHDKDQQKRLIVILEQASLETVKIGQYYELLNCDKHQGLIKKYKKGRDMTGCRPDIAHTALLHLMDSPLNQAGFLEVYIRTERNVLIKVDPRTKIPRTPGPFYSMMVQLLHKYSIDARAANGSSKKLLKVIKNPITDHLPTGCSKILLSVHGERVNITDLIPDDKPIVFVIGAMARGSVEVDYTERMVSLGSDPLSAALTCSYLTTDFEEKWCVTNKLPSSKNMDVVAVDEGNTVGATPSSPRRASHKSAEPKRLIVVLEQAALETVTIGKVHELLDCDKHKGLITQHKKVRDVSTCRTDIIRQCLHDLMDSPLNKNNLLQVYIRTAKDVLIEINPKTRLPRTPERFNGLMAQLLHQFSIKDKETGDVFLKIIKGPITQHLPKDCTKIAISADSESYEVVDAAELVPDDRPVVIVIGASAEVTVNVDYTERTVSMDEHPLSAFMICAKLTNAFQRKWIKVEDNAIEEADMES